MKGRQEDAQEGFGPIIMGVIEVADWLLSSRKKFQKPLFFENDAAFSKGISERLSYGKTVFAQGSVFR